MKNYLEFFLSEILSNKSTDIKYHLDTMKPGLSLINREMNLDVILYDTKTDPNKYYIEVGQYIKSLGKNQNPRAFEIKDVDRMMDISLEILKEYAFRDAKQSIHHMGYVKLFSDYFMGKQLDEKYKFKITRKKIELRVDGMRTVPYIEVNELDVLIKKLNSEESRLYPHSVSIKNLPEDKSLSMSNFRVPIYFNRLLLDKYIKLQSKKDYNEVENLSLSETEFFTEISKLQKINFGPLLKTILLEDRLTNRDSDLKNDNESIINKIKTKI